MIPLPATIRTSSEKGTIGDCFRTCIASLLELNHVQVPHFHDGDYTWHEWNLATNEWLAKFNLRLHWEYINQEELDLVHDAMQWGHNAESPSYFIVQGEGRSGHHHSCIIGTDGFFHDTAKISEGKPPYLKPLVKDMSGPVSDPFYLVGKLLALDPAKCVIDAQDTRGHDQEN